MCKSPFPKFGYPEQLALNLSQPCKCHLKCKLKTLLERIGILKDCSIWLSKKIKSLPSPPILSLCVMFNLKKKKNLLSEC